MSWEEVKRKESVGINQCTREVDSVVSGVFRGTGEHLQWHRWGTRVELWHHA